MITLKRKIFETIRANGPMTCEEVEIEWPHHPHQSVSARIKNLIDEGFIVKAGLKKGAYNRRVWQYKALK